MWFGLDGINHGFAKTENMFDKNIQDSWCIASLKDYQEKALASVAMERHDCLVCVPTGSGKSLCFEALCLVADHIHSQNVF